MLSFLMHCSENKSPSEASKDIDMLLEKKVFSASNGMQMPYRFFAPKSSEKDKKPLVIFLHGRGDRGTDNGSNIYREAGILTRSDGLFSEENLEKYASYILVPQCSDKTENEEWAKWIGNSEETPFKGLTEQGSYQMNPTPSLSGEAALELIEKTIQTHHIDPERVYILGVSMGGFGVWEFTARRPDLFAAAVPMAGYSDASQLEKLKNIPYWIFHGAKDPWNPVEGSRNMHEALSKAGADVTYTEFENLEHGDAFQQAFANPNLISWLFSKRKQQATLEFQIEASLGEGAIWDHQQQRLLWVDIEGKKIHQYNPESQENFTLEMPSRPGTIVPETSTTAVVALEDGIHRVNLNSSERTLISNMSADLKGSRLNDGKCDPSGRLWVGSMHFDQLKGRANLFKVNSDGSYQIQKDSVTISNGIVWTADKKTMYYIDTPTSQIKAYNFEDATGTISNERVVVEVPESLGFPDGMTIDAEGMLWVGMWNGNAVIRFDPATGNINRKIQVPAHNVTSCAFGGENLDTLYITTARLDMTAEELKQYPLAGSLFKVVPGVKGVKSHFFKSSLH
jgi:sugar lactone lactonase YvrE/predicted esterase